MPRPSTALLHPAQLNAQQVLGEFLPRFDSEGVVLICQAQGQLYPFGQWATVFGKCFVLGWCRFLDQARYDTAWYAGSPGPGPTEPPGAALQLGSLTDEAILARFVGQVACAGALLAYLGDGLDPTFWRWRTAAAKKWGESAGRERDPYMQPLWSEIPLIPNNLCPATYLSLVQHTGHAHRDITQARAQEYGWDEAHIATLTQLPPLRYTS